MNNLKKALFLEVFKFLFSSILTIIFFSYFSNWLNLEVPFYIYATGVVTIFSMIIYPIFKPLLTISRYISFSESEFESLENQQLKEIAISLSKIEKKYSSLSRLENSEVSVHVGSQYYQISTNVENIFKSHDFLSDYDNLLKRINLEYKAEKININQMNEAIDSAKEKLLKASWDISKTELKVAKKLYDLEMISEKELQVVKDRIIEEESIQSSNKKKMKNLYDDNLRKIYLNYILSKKL